jgi:hypothetical protein
MVRVLDRLVLVHGKLVDMVVLVHGMLVFVVGKVLDRLVWGLVDMVQVHGMLV